ncbi:MAG: histidyl-tRNA synthetase, histidyl-tRNA synthetase [Candidatus Parcubacteria bacterium]|jgi:histidyl-tRNA synthetase
MNDKKLSTDSYKGVRDFYPADMAIQRYIFDTWAKTAESFGFERYDASILEPSDLYKAKGAENEEMVNEQTYTFTDRGEREVTLRPEMTPTVARMVAAKRRELAFPLRWYSIPNLYRYERPQRGRLREFWQLNCDIFGADDIAADIEIIALTHQILLDFGATPDMFEIQVNDRQEMSAIYKEFGIHDEEMINAITRLNDRKNKITAEAYEEALRVIVQEEELVNKITALATDKSGSNAVIQGLQTLGITNAKLDRTIARGFNYYTGTVFEVVDTHPDNNRAILGGGRFDNLTSMFGGDPVSAIGFGMGDVPMRDFLETHNLLEGKVKSTVAQVVVIPESSEQNIFAQGIARQIRQAGLTVSTDIGTQKPDKKKARASERGSKYIMVIGENEIVTQTFTLKNLQTGEEIVGELESVISQIVSK